MPKYTLLLFSLCLTLSLVAQEPANWLRHSAISPDGAAIAFTYKGDLYSVPSQGGKATQLTFHQAHDHGAVWSEDGATIAFASNRYGNFDVYTMPAVGGPATRLTFHSNDETPYAFTPDGSAVTFGTLRQDAATHRQHPHGSQPELYSVPTEGGRVDQILTVPAEAVEYAGAGGSFYYHDKKGGENIFRKHQQSSITRDIWHFDAETGAHQQITKNNREDRHPTLSDDGTAIYFLSERSGTFNVWKMPVGNPAEAAQLTTYTTHPVRYLSQGGGTISYGFDGELYTLREGTQPRKVNVDIITQAAGNQDKFITINGGVQEMAVAPNGKEIAFISRGEVFVTSVEAGFTKRLTNTPAQERFLSWGPDGKSVVYSREGDGKWSAYATTKTREEEPFFYAATLTEEKPVLDNDADNYLVRYSPDGKKMAWVEDRRNIKVRNVDGSGEVTLLDTTELFHMRDGDKDFSWSPDSEWLLVDWSILLQDSEILLMKADGSKRVNLTESGYYDNRPKWTGEGQQMLWFSNRDGLKSYATSGRSQSDVYAMYFTQEKWDEAQLSEEEMKLAKAVKEALKEAKKEAEKEKGDDDDKDDKNKEKKDEKDKKGDKKKEVKPLTFDWENLEDRTKRLTIHSSRLGDAVLSKDGEKLYYIATFEKDANLWSTNLRTKETKKVMSVGKGGSMQWDTAHKQLFLLSGGSLSIIDTEKGKKKAIKLKGEMEYDAVAERAAMFDHVWQRTDAIFYEPSFHGRDWSGLRGEYEKFLPSIGNSHEFTEMISEMLGELNVSHAGARYRGGKIENADATASLGIFQDYDFAGPGIRVAEVLAGGPLDKAAFDVTPGVIIEAVDGEAIAADRDVAQYLNRKAGDFTLLEIFDPETDKRETITVKPISLGEERRLLYKRWVKQNEAEVAEKSDGKVGYVHIPGMGDGPYRDIYEDMLGKYRGAESIIVDTRFNGGGDLVADLAMFFTGVPFITYATEAKVVGGEPTSRWTKPTMVLMNEAQYSDGHCFAQGYTDLEIGPTLGMPVPGTCSFAGWERLPDGSIWGVVPVSAKNRAGQWMENNQTEPDILVKNQPGNLAEGRDEQLERAIEVMLEGK